MIGQITGKISHSDSRSIIIDVNGVGYKIFVSTDTLSKTKEEKSPLTFWTHLVVREDVLDLYGFLTKNELDFFELLISISGVGPRGALSILSLAPPDTLKKAISSGNTSYLTQVSGIGRKIAEKIVLELRDKIGVIESEGGNLDQEAETVLALESLGYSNKEAREALRKIPASITDTSEQVKEVLRQLGKKKWLS